MNSSNMKNIMIKVTGMLFLILSTATVFAQNIDEQRMDRDIQVVENVLSTLLRQQFDKQRMFFPLEVKGSYQPGYGVTFRLPADFTTPIVFSFDGLEELEDQVMHWNIPLPPDAPDAPGEMSYSYHIDNNEIEIEDENDDVKVEREVEVADKAV